MDKLMRNNNLCEGKKMNNSLPPLLGDQKIYWEKTRKRKPSWYFLKTKNWKHLLKRLANYDFKKEVEYTGGKITYKFRHCFFVKNKEYLWKYISRRYLVPSEQHLLKEAFDMTRLVVVRNSENKLRVWEQVEAHKKFVPIELKREFLEIESQRIVRNISAEVPLPKVDESPTMTARL